MLQLETIQHVEKHWDLMMLQINETPQHQHPSILRRKETPAVSNTARRTVVLVVRLLIGCEVFQSNFEGIWLAVVPGKSNHEQQFGDGDSVRRIKIKLFITVSASHILNTEKRKRKKSKLSWLLFNFNAHTVFMLFVIKKTIPTVQNG